MGTSITVNIVPKCEVCPRDHGKVVESLRGECDFNVPVRAVQCSVGNCEPAWEYDQDFVKLKESAGPRSSFVNHI